MISKKSQIYGQALFELEGTEEIFFQLKELTDIFLKIETRNFFQAFTISFGDKKKILEQALKTTKPLLKNFFLTVLENKSFSLLPEVVEAYQNLLDEKLGICRGELYSSVEISNKQKEKIEDSLKCFFNKKVHLSLKEDKSLVGGLYIKFCSYIFDNTVKQQLKQFQTLGG